MEPIRFTSAFRIAVKTRVSETGWPPTGQREPFIQTMNCRQGNGGCTNRILRFLFLRQSLIEIRTSAFITAWKKLHLRKPIMHDGVHEEKANYIVGQLHTARTYERSILRKGTPDSHGFLRRERMAEACKSSE